MKALETNTKGLMVAIHFIVLVDYVANCYTIQSN